MLTYMINQQMCVYKYVQPHTVVLRNMFGHLRHHHHGVF